MSERRFVSSTPFSRLSLFPNTFRPRGSPSTLSFFRENTVLNFNRTFLNESSAILSNFAVNLENELECDLAYGSYLQNLMKQQVLERTVEKHQEDLTDQLVIQKDRTFNSKKKIRTSKQELKQLSMFEELNEVLEFLNKIGSTLDEFDDLSGTVKQVVSLLDRVCHNINVKNINTEIFVNKEGFEKLNLLLQKCSNVIKDLNLQHGNVKETVRLAAVINEYQRILKLVSKNYEFLEKSQSNALWKLFVMLSNVLAK